MFLRTEFIKERKFVGQSIQMSLIDNLTFQLWSTFKPNIGLINHRINNHFISLQEYGGISYFSNFKFTNIFTKYALVEVSAFENDSFDHVRVTDTLYAVFLHKGSSENFPLTMNYILSEWLPNSLYRLADAAHFEVLDKRYKKESPDSQEEIWIPIQIK